MKREDNKLTFTEEQVQQILEDLAKEKDGYNKVLKCAVEALMQAECRPYNEKNNTIFVIGCPLCKHRQAFPYPPTGEIIVIY